MARHRQIIGPRQVALVVIEAPPFVPELLMAFDSAVDLTRTDYGKYKESLYDRRHLAIKEGQRPSLFTIQPLTMAQKLSAPAANEGLSRAAFFVRCGLTRIDEYSIEINGDSRPIPQPDRRKNGQLGDMATPEWLLECGLSEEDIRALGFMIAHISEAQSPLATSSGDLSTHGGPKSPATETPAS